MSSKNDLLAIWRSGVAAVQGRSSVNSALAAHQITRPDFVIAAGKAAASMAAAVHDTFGKIPTLIVTKYDHTEDAPKHAKVVQSAHPVPDEASLAGGAAIVPLITTSRSALWRKSRVSLLVGSVPSFSLVKVLTTVPSVLTIALAMVGFQIVPPLAIAA